MRTFSLVLQVEFISKKVGTNQSEEWGTHSSSIFYSEPVGPTCLYTSVGQRLRYPGWPLGVALTQFDVDFSVSFLHSAYIM